MRRTMTCPKCGDALGVEHHSPNQRVLICPATLTCGWAQTQLLADDGLWRSAADVAKEKGRGAAARNAGAVWREQALEAAHDLALAHGHLTAADLRRHMEGLGIGEPPSPGARPRLADRCPSRVAGGHGARDEIAVAGRQRPKGHGLAQPGLRGLSHRAAPVRWCITACAAGIT